MRFNICTLLNNGFGLDKDVLLLEALLKGWGHEVRGVCIKSDDGEILTDVEPADVNIFLELVSAPLINRGIAKQNWLVPNQEWYRAAWDQSLSRMGRILCKTHEAVRAFSGYGFADKCQYIGWESTDFYDPSVERKRAFLHVSGGSASKNTVAVAYAFANFFYNPFAGSWNQNKNLPLIVVSRDRNIENLLQGKPNTKYFEDLPLAEIKRLMNECIFHIMPSAAEGWGHVIHEGLGCGAVMLTTDFPPMNEYAGLDHRLLITSQKHELMNTVGRSAWVGAYDLKARVETAWAYRPEQIALIQKEAREAFLAQRESFHRALKEVVDNASN